MKKLSILVLSIAFLTNACKKKNLIPPTKDLLVGKWKSSQTATDDNGNNKPDMEERQDVDSSDTEYITFYSDGSGLVVYQFSGTDSSRFTWTLINDDKDLQIVEDNMPEIAHISAITPSDLIIESADNEPGEPKDWFFLKKQ